MAVEPFPRQPRQPKAWHNPLAGRSKTFQLSLMPPRILVIPTLVLAATGALPAQLYLSEPVKSLKADFTSEQTLFEFPYTNRSGVALKITDISVGCGCLRPEVTSKTLQPGETGKLRFTFDHATREGEQEVKATVTTDDGKPAQELTAKVDIPTWVDVSPKLLFWSDPEKPTTIISEIRINTPEARKIKAVKAATPGFKVELEEIEAGRRYRVKATPEGKTPHLLSEVSITMEPALPATKQVRMFLRVM